MRNGLRWKKGTVKIEILFLAQFERMGKKGKDDELLKMAKHELLYRTFLLHPWFEVTKWRLSILDSEVHNLTISLNYLIVDFIFLKMFFNFSLFLYSFSPWIHLLILKNDNSSLNQSIPSALLIEFLLSISELVENY